MNEIKKRISSYQELFDVGGFVWKQARKELEEACRDLAFVMSEDYVGKGVSKAGLAFGCVALIADLLDEYDPAEDGDLLSFVEDFFSQSMESCIEEVELSDPFCECSSAFYKDEVLNMLPFLERYVLQFRTDGQGNVQSCSKIADHFGCLNTQRVLKLVCMAEKSYAHCEDILERALESEV